MDVNHPLLDAYERALRSLETASPARVGYEVRVRAHTDAREAIISALNSALPAQDVGGPSRFHLTEPTVILQTADGERIFGAGWLLISEAEYRAIADKIVIVQNFQAHPGHYQEEDRSDEAADPPSYRHGWRDAVFALLGRVNRCSAALSIKPQERSALAVFSPAETEGK